MTLPEDCPPTTPPPYARVEDTRSYGYGGHVASSITITINACEGDLDYLSYLVRDTVDTWSKRLHRNP